MSLAASTTGYSTELNVRSFPRQKSRCIRPHVSHVHSAVRRQITSQRAAKFEGNKCDISYTVQPHVREAKQWNTG